MKAPARGEGQRESKADSGRLSTECGAGHGAGTHEPEITILRS